MAPSTRQPCTAASGTAAPPCRCRWAGQGSRPRAMRTRGETVPWSGSSSEKAAQFGFLGDMNRILVSAGLLALPAAQPSPVRALLRPARPCQHFPRNVTLEMRGAFPGLGMSPGCVSAAEPALF